MTLDEAIEHAHWWLECVSDREYGPVEESDKEAVRILLEAVEPVPQIVER